MDKISWETFFLKNHVENVVEELFPDSLLENQNWAYLWIICLKFYTVCFYCVPSWGLAKYFKTKLQTTYLTSFEAFFFKKKRFVTSLPTSFSAWILKKNISLVIFHELTNFHCLVTSTSWDIGQSCDIMNFEINLIFLIKSFFLHDQKVKTKILISWGPKGLLRWKGFHWSK